MSKKVVSTILLGNGSQPETPQLPISFAPIGSILEPSYQDLLLKKRIK